MRRLQIWLVPLMGVAVLLLTGALFRKPPAVAAVHLVEVGPLPNDKDALQLLDQAIAAYRPERIPWQRADLWQRVQTERGSQIVQGRYAIGPKCQLRLELTTTVGKTQAVVLLVGDGQRLWQRKQIGSDAPRITQYELPVVTKEKANDANFLAMRTRNLHFQSFGISTLLSLVREAGQHWQGKRVQWHGAEVYHLTATGFGNASNSNASNQEETVESKGLPPLPQATQVCIFLDVQTLWPQRLEWWGAGNDGNLQPLIEMEFRTPVLNQPLTKAECQREFTFLPD